ncbi:hypothetical protein ACLOJK_021887 [Asimina triloba]
MADAVVSLLLEKLVTFLMNEGRQLIEFEDKLDEIRKEFQYMQNYVKDADRVKRRDRTETLKLIMNDVRELTYDAEEIIADCQLLSQKKKQGRASSSFSPTLLKSRYVLGKKLKDLNKRIKEVKQNMVSYLATVPVHGRKEVSENIPLTHPILMTEDSIVGLEDESRRIINSLLAKNEHFKVFGIVGIGGIGKTTLAQKIFKSKIIETKFKHLIFVTVSQSFRFDELLRKMLSKVGIADGLLHGKGVDDLLEILKNELDGKYLIILDDVWGVDEGQWWYSMASALPKGNGGCVMVTTRNEEVARYMGATYEHICHADILSEENSWSLFCKIAFAMNGGISPNGELEKCGKEIVVACRGLPLTIRTVGGMMLAKGDSIIEWERMSKNLKQEMATSKKLDELVISRLELSYEELPTNVRPCLFCLAVYPEDFGPSSSRIIDMWIAEGFVWGRRDKTASEMGEECLNEMCNRCLISKDEEEQFGNGLVLYKMHDAVREMLIKIATEENFFSLNQRDGHMASKLSRRVVMHENVSEESIENNSARLRTLVAFETESKVMSPCLEADLKKLRRLRTLYLLLSHEIDVTVKSTKWLSGIGSLRHLVYLHLQNIDALTTLPDSIGNLRHLQILNIIRCCNLESLPPSITKLEKLIVLTVCGCEKIECLPEGLGKLSNLEQFTCVKSNNFDVANSWMSLTELKNLRKLRLLSVEISEEEQVGEKEWTTLQMPESLQILYLTFPGVTPACAAGIARKMDRPFHHPLQYLKELYLDCYPGESTPTWLSPTSLPYLSYLRIAMGRIKNIGEGFFAEGAAWKVETLVLLCLEEFEEDWEIIERAMPCLKLAHVQDCPKLGYTEEAFQPGRYGWRTWKKHIRVGVELVSCGVSSWASGLQAISLVPPDVYLLLHGSKFKRAFNQQNNIGKRGLQPAGGNGGSHGNMLSHLRLMSSNSYNATRGRRYAPFYALSLSN